MRDGVETGKKTGSRKILLYPEEESGVNSGEVFVVPLLLVEIFLPHSP